MPGLTSEGIMPGDEVAVPIGSALQGGSGLIFADALADIPKGKAPPYPGTGVYICCKYCNEKGQEVDSATVFLTSSSTDISSLCNRSNPDSGKYKPCGYSYGKCPEGEGKLIHPENIPALCPGITKIRVYGNSRASLYIEGKRLAEKDALDQAAAVCNEKCGWRSRNNCPRTKPYCKGYLETRDPKTSCRQFTETKCDSEREGGQTLWKCSTNYQCNCKCECSKTAY